MKTNEFGITQHRSSVPHWYTDRKAVATVVAIAAIAAGLVVPATRQDFIGLYILAVILGLYFLPTLVAAHRHARNTGSIIAINLLLGWTLIGWVVALAMALADTHRPASTEAPR